METIIECTVVSKKETINWNKEYPVSTAIELQVPYDQNNIFYQLSGGTNMILNTVNQKVADEFKINDKVELKLRKL